MHIYCFSFIYMLLAEFCCFNHYYLDWDMGFKLNFIYKYKIIQNGATFYIDYFSKKYEDQVKELENITKIKIRDRKLKKEN